MWVLVIRMLPYKDENLSTLPIFDSIPFCSLYLSMKSEPWQQRVDLNMISVTDELKLLFKQGSSTSTD